MPESEWTVSTLKQHLEAIISGLEKNVGTAMAAADKAVNKAEQASERRFEGVNEFRKALSDQTATFVTREKFESLEQQFRDMRGETTGRSKGIGSVGQILFNVVMASIAVAAVVVTLLLHK